MKPNVKKMNCHIIVESNKKVHGTINQPLFPCWNKAQTSYFNSQYKVFTLSHFFGDNPVLPIKSLKNNFHLSRQQIFTWIYLLTYLKQ
jgi:hypothetical protein